MQHHVKIQLWKIPNANNIMCKIKRSGFAIQKSCVYFTLLQIDYYRSS